MATRVRFPELINSQDPHVRSWANELIRSLTEYVNESKFIEVEAIVTAGSNITVSADPYSEKIFINAGSTGTSEATGSDGLLDGGNRMTLDGTFDGGLRI